MKKFVLLVTFVFLIASCKKMELQQYVKEMQAEQTGISRHVTIYEQGKEIWSLKGMCNIEYADITGSMTITENRGNDILCHKIKVSKQTLVIIEELGTY